MNDPQVWTLIGVFTTVMLGGMTLMTTLLTRTMNAGFRAVDAKFDAVDAKFEAVDAKFETVYVKLEHLDRDVQALTRHVFGPDRG